MGTRRMRRMNTIREKFAPDKVLVNWITLHSVLTKMNTAELRAALNTELARPKDERRADILMRVFRRLHKLRGKQQLEKLLTQA